MKISGVFCLFSLLLVLVASSSAYDIGYQGTHILTHGALEDTLFYHTELAGEREHPLRAAERLYKSFDVSSVEIVDAKGITVASAKNPDTHGKDKSSDALIKTALGGSSASGITITEDGFVITASAPIDYNEGQIIGAITAGIAINGAVNRTIGCQH
ncbi:MAG: hypothetical protein QMD44_05325 [Thermodesulfovibrionales bacterium]|jgi:hypothetical protein|nr:hypothetical protein [Thermodesulfovibrionales bacterium]